MEEEKDPSASYIKGFNHGYELSKRDPSLFKEISRGLKPNGEYSNALDAGKKQFEREQLLKQLEEAKSQNKEKQRER